MEMLNSCKVDLELVEKNCIFVFIQAGGNPAFFMPLQ